MDGNKLNNFKPFKFNNEGDFESLILSNQVFTDYQAFDCKKIPLNFKFFKRYADVILIEKNYKFWMIGEVEVTKHSFSSHIFPQLLEINILLEKNIEIIRDLIIREEFVENDKKIKELIQFNKPFFTLIIDGFPNKYRGFMDVLRNLSNIFIVDTFKDNLSRYMFSNEVIKSYNFINLSSECYIKRNFLYIDMPNLLEIGIKNDTSLIYDNYEVDIKNSVQKIKEDYKIVIWTMSKKIKNGKYIIKRINNKLHVLK